MYQSHLTDYLLLTIGIWLAILSFFLIKTINHYRKLTKGVRDIDLVKLLEHIIEGSDTHGKNLASVSKDLTDFRTKAQGFLQKYALIRFNPFEDQGGDQSFTVALLDGNDNGIVVSSLHSRGGVRVYAKAVKSAKSDKHQFTKEEKEAVEKAARHAQFT